VSSCGQETTISTCPTDVHGRPAVWANRDQFVGPQGHVEQRSKLHQGFEPNLFWRKRLDYHRSRICLETLRFNDSGACAVKQLVINMIRRGTSNAESLTDESKPFALSIRRVPQPIPECLAARLAYLALDHNRDGHFSGSRDTESIVLLLATLP